MRKSTATSADAVDKSASGWHTIKRVGPYLWPPGEPWVKRRVVLAMFFLVCAKLVSATTPYIYKLAVDALGGKTPDAAMALALGAIGLTVAYGMARLAKAQIGGQTGDVAGAAQQVAEIGFLLGIVAGTG